MVHGIPNWLPGGLAAMATLVAAVAAAQSPVLDPAFGEGGRVWVGSAYEGTGAQEAQVVLAQDGGILLVTGMRLDRYDAKGLEDPGFGYGDAGIAGGDLAPGWIAAAYGRPVARPDGSIVLPVLARAESQFRYRLGALKLRPDGRRDPAFGSNGFAMGGAPVSNLFVARVAGAAVESDGRIVVAGWGWNTVAGGVALARFLADGSIDGTFGDEGARIVEPAWTAPVFAASSDGGFALAFEDRVIRFLPGGERDPQIETVLDPWQGDKRWFDLVVDSDGTIVVHRTVIGDCFFSSCIAETLARFDGRGAPDVTFGDAGTIYRTDAPDAFQWYGVQVAFAPDAERGILVLGGGGTVHRLDRHGAADSRYSNGGIASVREPFGVSARAFAVAADGTVVMVAGVPQRSDVWQGGPAGPWRMALYRLRPTWEGHVGDVTLVEYFNAHQGHYFVTPLPHEQQALDAAGSGWQRTGRTFAAWSTGDPNLRNVCRFFSGDTFAPKGTDFYTHLEAECEALRKKPQWIYEGATFAVRLPEGLPATRCPSRTRPLYRAYNNGIGNAPNHRYTTDVTVLDAMVAQGWVAEGERDSRVFACVAN